MHAEVLHLHILCFGDYVVRSNYTTLQPEGSGSSTELSWQNIDMTVLFLTQQLITWDSVFRQRHAKYPVCYADD